MTLPATHLRTERPEVALRSPVTMRCLECEETTKHGVTVTKAREQGWRGPDGLLRNWRCPACAKRKAAS